jgi:hypothetical protein
MSRSVLLLAEYRLTPARRKSDGKSQDANGDQRGGRCALS